LISWAAAKGVHYVEIRGETLRQPIGERHYPAEYQKVFQQVGPSRGVPRFLRAVDGRVRLNTVGTHRYDEIFLPILKQSRTARTHRSAEVPASLRAASPLLFRRYVRPRGRARIYLLLPTACT
jgi:hypothetical protein